MNDPYGRIVHIVQLDESWYLRAQYAGGIRKTAVSSYACLYHSDRAAKGALKRARKYEPFPSAKVVLKRLNLEEVT